jgi:hypothetical protein
MKITIETKIESSQFEQMAIPKEKYDELIKEEMFIKIAKEVGKHITILQSHFSQPFNHFLYHGQIIVLSMDSFKNLMILLESKLSCQDYLEIRELLNEKI